MPKPVAATDDFGVKFANVNGSGSASANELFALSILRMGVPVTSRNIFPSNIQGLPTWYEVRVSEAGWLGRRGGVDLMVAMNPQTWDKDIAEIGPGGYLFYDSTKALPKSKFRDDVNVIGMPLMEICNAAYTDPRQRQLFKNIIYVGALAALLDIDLAEVEKLIGEQYKGKEKLLEPNVKALHMGRDYALAHLPPPGLKVKRADGVGNRVFLEGNNAAALGCVYGGATVAAWYPITPSSSMAEAFARHCRKYRTDPDTGKARYAIVQAEDELASIGMVIGAAWNGARSFTCTSGPGVSLMQEFIGLADLSGNAPEARLLLHARHEPGPVRALYGGGQRLRGQHAAPAEEVRDRQGAGARARGAQGREGLALRRDLLRLDRAGHGRGARHPRRGGDGGRRDAHPRIPVRRRGRRLRGEPRPRVRGGAEPRRPATHAPGGRGPGGLGKAHAGAALRRHAHHRALHPFRDRPAPEGLQRHAHQEDRRRLTDAGLGTQMNANERHADERTSTAVETLDSRISSGGTFICATSAFICVSKAFCGLAR